MKPVHKIFLIVFSGLLLFAVIYFSADYWKHRARIIQCDDGERETIDYTELQLKYSSHKIALELEIIDKIKFRPEIDPKVLQTAYESTQNWDQFLKGLVAGYNSCAVSKKDYVLIFQSYKKIEEITKSLSQILQKSPLTQQDVKTVKQLIEQYSSTAKEITTQ